VHTLKINFPKVTNVTENLSSTIHFCVTVSTHPPTHPPTQDLLSARAGPPTHPLPTLCKGRPTHPPTHPPRTYRKQGQAHLPTHPPTHYSLEGGAHKLLIMFFLAAVSWQRFRGIPAAHLRHTRGTPVNPSGAPLPSVFTL